MGPGGLGPEGAAIDEVLEVVAEDVGLLQEEAHVAAEGALAAAPDVVGEAGLEAAGGELAREALADEAGDEVAVGVVLGPGARPLP